MNVPTDRKAHLGAAMEQIALDSMGSLKTGDDQAWVRKHLQDGCDVCREARARVDEVFAELLLAAPPIKPPASVRDKVMRSIAGKPQAEKQALPDDAADIQIWNRWTATENKFFTVAAEAGRWEDTAIEGIKARVLRVDEERDEVTMIVRMAAGTSYPSHRHAGDEQCYVLDGDLQVEEQEMGSGDYQFCPEGSIHGIQSTKGGCTLLIISSRSDEILAG